MRNLLQGVKEAARKLSNMVSRAVVQSTDESKKTILAQVELTEGEVATEVEHPQEYGFRSRAKSGASALVVFIGGNRDHPTCPVIYDDRNVAIAMGLEEGEVIIYNGEAETFIWFSNDGKIYVQGDLIVTGNIVASGNVSDANGSIQEMRNAYNPHTHGGGSAPSPQMT